MGVVERGGGAVDGVQMMMMMMVVVGMGMSQLLHF